MPSPSSPAQHHAAAAVLSNSLEDKVQALLVNNPMDFSSWTSLIMEIEETSSGDMDIISRAYEPFLSEFPLCYGYWEKYATHKARLCSIDKVIEVYEEAVKAATYSVDVWTNYCSFAMEFYEDLDDIRRLYERGLASVGKDYRCDILWDKCIEFEHSHKQWNHLIHIYVRSLRFPTKKLYSYYQSFRELVAMWVEEMKCQNIAIEPIETAVTCELAEMNMCNDLEIRRLTCDLLDQAVGLLRPKTLQKILAIGEYFYQKSTNIDDKIRHFEAQIRRPYFHIKALDDYQLQIWHRYLDFVEMQGDLDWAVKLYERCLIPCANYPDFWVRYIETMEARGGREIATLALARASKTFLKRIPQFQLYCSKVMEQVDDVDGIRASLLKCDMCLSSNLVDHVNQQANLEKRLGNIGAAYLIYERAMEVVREQDIQAFSVLCMHFARFTYVVTGDLSATREVFVKGISRAPHYKPLFEGLITFMALHGGTRQIGAVDSIVGHAIVPEPGVSMALSPSDQEEVSSLFLEFVDLCGAIHEIRKAWARHIRLFPHAMRPITSFGCNINGIGTVENIKEKNDVQDNAHGNGIGDSDKQLLFEDSQSSRENRDLLLDGPALAAKSHSEVASNNTNGNPEQTQLSENAKELPEHEAIQLPEDTDSLLHEAHIFSPNTRGPSGCPEAEHQSQPLPDCESHDDLSPSLKKLSITHPDDETQQSIPIALCDDNATQSPSNGIDHNCEGNEVEEAQQPNDSKSVMPAISHTLADNSFKSTHSEQNLQLAEENTMPQNQQVVQAHTIPVYPQDFLNWHLVHNNGQVFEQQSKFHGHVQTQQHQQLQVPVQLQYPHSAFNSQVSATQPYACPPQLWQASTQMANQLQGQYQMATTQVYPAGTIVLQPPNIQQNFMAGGPSQLFSQMVTQTHVYQHPLQNNEQCGYFQDSQNVSSQFWHYYRQQLSQQQQQQQQPGYNIQFQNPQQHQQQNGSHQLQLQQNIIQQWQQQNQQQTNLLQLQEREMQQQLHQTQHSQTHHSQPCPTNKLQESLSRQDLSQTQQNQDYMQHQSWQQYLLMPQQRQGQSLPKHQEQQQQIFATATAASAAAAATARAEAVD